MKKSDQILLLALGNEILCDDGIALSLLNELKEKFRSAFIKFRTSMNGGIEIVELLTNYNQVIILDSIKTLDGIPGTVYHFTPDDFSETTHVSSFHDVSFLTALKFAEYLRIDLPKKIDIVAVEIVEDMLFTEDFSKEIEKRYTAIKTQVEKIVVGLLPGHIGQKQHKNKTRKMRV